MRKSQYGFVPTSITSWVGNSIVAFLDKAQIDALSQDARVAGITPDVNVEMSTPLWSDSHAAQGQVISWGTNATGQQFSGGGPVTVYVLDAGVGYHRDLTSVTSRLSAISNINVVGCYPHATHVAGIVAAAGTTLGTSRGVYVSTPIVSVAVGNSNTLSGCSNGSPASGYSVGLDLIKSMITQTATVGIVNISSNGADFRATGTVGQKIANVATPGAGYPGAFVVESAGNDFQNACSYSYDAPQASDGIMVVGALDANGQPVKPLNGIGGFRNSPNAANEAGSNYGSCVEIWAPGNGIYSTWAPNPQRNLPSQPYSNHVNLSGTSMAAPHVSGLAAYFTSVFGLSSPSAIENQVRAYMFALGSKGQDGAAIYMANSTGSRPVAKPTAEFLIDGLVNGTVSNKYSDQSFQLSYDSVGAQSCSLTAYLNGSLWYQIVNFQAAYNWGLVQLQGGTYLWSVDCVSTQGTHNTASASATITQAPPAPVATWYVNGSAISSGQTVNLSHSSSFTLRYSSTGADYCDLSVYSGPIGGFLSPWYSISHFSTSYDWGSVMLNTSAYRYQIDCPNSRGQNAEAVLNLIVN